jgi:signal-transduction protein with cAMP-binding, CBS, and nucleotidyltransferase domain
VRISVSAPDRILAVLGPGEFFGEMALLSAKPRTATATAATPANLVELRRRAVEEVEELVPELRQAMLEAYRQRLVDQALARHPAFADLNREQRELLVSFFRPVALNPGEDLSPQGACLVVVRSGQLRVDRRRLTEGDICGVEIFLGGAAPPTPLHAVDTAAVFIFGVTELERLKEAAPAIPALVAHGVAQAGL